MAFGERYQAQLPDGSPLVLRPPALEEFEALLPVPPEVKQYTDPLAYGPGALPYEKKAEYMVSDFDDDDLITVRGWGIEAYGRMVGCVGTEMREDDLYPSLFVYILDPSAWGRGIGTRASTVVAYDTFESGYDVFTSGAHPDNAASKRMHLRMGFVQTSEAKKRPLDANWTAADEARHGRIWERWDDFVLPRPTLSADTNLPELVGVDRNASRQLFLRQVAGAAIQKLG
jgi:RimJ/RimL family protein N-acetyltransferase